MRQCRKRQSNGLYLRGNFYWMNFTMEGKHYQRSTGTSDRKIAEAILGKIKAEIIEGKWFDKDVAMQHTYDEMMLRCVEEHVPTLEHSTGERYKVLKSHLDSFFSGMTLAQIDTNKVLQYVEYRKGQKCKPATRNRELALLSKAFNLARLWKWAKENPCQLVKREKEDNKDFGRALTPAEEKALSTAAAPYLNGQLADIITLAIHTGMRRGEILSLKWQNVDLFKRTIKAYNEKANRDKLIPMNATTHKLFTARAKVTALSGYVFHTVNNTPISPWNLAREWWKVLREAKIENFRFHDLRHTAGTRLVQSGADLYSVAAILDHTQLSTTQRYAKHNPDSVRKHVEQLDKFAVLGG